MKSNETREYTDAEVEAFASADEVKAAIQQVGRGIDRDEIRKAIAERAKALGVGELIPDNWNVDGSLREAKMVWNTTEERETYNDLWTALDDVVQEEFSQSDAWGYSWCWLQDITDGEVIFQSGGALYSAPYELVEGGPISLGDPVRVRPITTYVPTKVETEMLAQRADAGECPTCGGTGKVKGGSTTCPDCGGSGDADDEAVAAKPDLVIRVRTHLDGRKIAEEVLRSTQRRRAPATQTAEWRRAHAPKKGETERRNFPLGGLEIREDEDSDTILLVGYASVTGTGYSVGHYEETISRGAFKRTLSNPDLDCQLLVNHTGLPLARTTSGTLRLTEDDRGLRVEADLDPTDPDVQALVPKMRRGDVTEMSFAFRATEQDWSKDYSERTITQVDIQRGDVSVVSYGASPTTQAALRAEESLFELRAAGFEAFLDALCEWADWRNIPSEERAGKSISSANMETLTRVLNLVASADEAVDEAQPLLADLMGVPNPDASDADADDDAEEKSVSDDLEKRAPDEPEAGSTPPTAPQAPIRRNFRAETNELRMWFEAQQRDNDDRRAA